MCRLHAAAAAFLLLSWGAPALAQDADKSTPDITVSGSATITSDYRFRGVSQTDKEMAVQGGLTIGHKSGASIGTGASHFSAWGTFGGANMELDLIAGYKLPLSDHATLDVGLTWYMYPGGADKTDFPESYVKLSGTTGPATLAACRNLTVNVSYIDTDIARRQALYSQPGFSKGQDGSGSIANGTVFASLAAAF